MKRLKESTSIFLFLLVFLLSGVLFLSGIFKKEVRAYNPYDCTPDYCFNGLSYMYNVYMKGAMSGICTFVGDVSYQCSGTDTRCEGGIGTDKGYYLDAACTDPAQKWCCTSTKPCTCNWVNDSCGGDSCAANEMRQTKSCTPSGCDSGSRCVTDSSCEDTTAPTTSANPTSRSWSYNDVSVTITASDTGGSGVNRIEYCWTTGSSCENYTTVYSSSTTVTRTTNGDWMLCHRARDNAENIGTRVCNGRYQIDKTLPTVSASNSSSTWFNNQRTATVSASDTGGSGLAQVRYKWGSNFENNSCDSTSGGTVTSNGATLNAPSGGTTLYLCARDGAGNVKTWSGTYNWENIGPNVTFNPNSASWTNQNVGVSVGVSDSGGSGLKQWRYRLSSDDGSSYGSWSSWRTSSGIALTFTSQGKWRIQVEAEDNATNLTTAISGTYRIDKTPPTVSASNSSSSWFDNQRTATVSASDTGGSGLAQVRYSWGSNDMNSACDGGGAVTSNGATLNAPSGGTTLYLCARDGASNTATWSGTYNWCTPTVPQDPTNIFIKYQGGSYPGIFPLSSNLNSRTRLPVLHDDQTGTLYLPEQVPPTCMTDYGYIYETSDGGGGTYVAPNYIHTYNPQDALRDEGDTGDARGRYYNHTMAGTLMLSNWKKGYYKINNNPDFNCPTIDNESDNTSTRNCVSTTYTGVEVNNPLKFEIIGSDLDGVEEIKGAIVWLSKNGTIEEIPDAPMIGPFYEYSDPNHIAVMVMQRSGSWANTPLLYAPDATNGNNWGNITSHKEIRIKDGTETVVMAKVGNVNVSVNGEDVKFNIELILNEVASDQTTYPEGNYNVSGLVFDEHMLLAGGVVVDQYFMSTDCRTDGWNIDLRRPIFESGSPSSETLFSRVLRLLWNFNGTGSYATDAVINGYSYSSTNEIILESPGGYPNITLSTPPEEGQIGVINDTNAWNIINSFASETYDSNANINIGTNDEGTIILYVTGFDQACNYVISEDPVTINLNPWITSKGGFVYSGDNVGAHAKDYTAYSGFINSVLRKVTADELDIGTEVVTSRSGTISEFIQDLGAVRASGIHNSNSQMSSGYEYFSNRLAEQMVVLGQNNFRLFGFPSEGIENNRISDYCVTPFLPQAEREYCYMNIQGNLNVVPSYQKILPNGERRYELICDKKTLIMASGNIHIEPDIINGGDDNINGCIFVAGGNITVGAGDWVTQNATELEDTKYDYLDAYLVADGMIDIQLVDLKEPGDAGSVIYTRDGLEMYGGLVAFGRNIPTGTSAVQANRSFGLWNAYIPTTTITWDPRYAKLAEAFFGSTAAMYKREVGFKPY